MEFEGLKRVRTLKTGITQSLILLTDIFRTYENLFLVFSRNQSLTSKFVASKVATNGNAGGDKFIRIRLLPAILLPGNSNARGGGGDAAYERGGDTQRNF